MKGYLSIKDVSKEFPGVKALDGVSINIRLGEVHALCGENGAGKSTLMNILSGNYRMDGGEISYDGEPCVFHSPHEAHKNGFSIVHQERSLVDTLSVADNIFVNSMPARAGIINKKAAHEKTRQILDRLKQRDIGPGDIVGTLSPAKQQMVEICKALNQNPKVLILDEPTATITETEVNILFELIRDLKKQGVTVIYISHRLAEIFEICERVSVLRDGKFQATKNVADIRIDDVVSLMVGRKLTHERMPSRFTGEELLRVESLSGAKFQNLSFSLNRGEILGFAGLAGAGRTEMARAIFGADKKTGKIFVRGKEARIRRPDVAIALGIGYLPEDRKLDGLFLDMSVEENVVSGNIRHIAPKGLIKKSAMTRSAVELGDKLRIITPTVKRHVLDLSGGNQQKVVIAKWMLVNSEILIVDEPTRGVDVGAKEEIYKIIHDMVSAGKGVIMISSDLPEVLRMSDRIVVMYNGRITGTLDNRNTDVSEETVMRYASGLEA